jgi:hypothetical protein
LIILRKTLSLSRSLKNTLKTKSTRRSGTIMALIGIFSTIMVLTYVVLVVTQCTWHGSPTLLSGLRVTVSRSLRNSTNHKLSVQKMSCFWHLVKRCPYAKNFSMRLTVFCDKPQSKMVKKFKRLQMIWQNALQLSDLKMFIENMDKILQFLIK